METQRASTWPRGIPSSRQELYAFTVFCELFLMQRDGVRQERLHADPRHFVTGYLHMRAFQGGTVARFTAAADWHSVNLAPMLQGVVLKKIDGEQLYLVGQERRSDEVMVAQGWWLRQLST